MSRERGDVVVATDPFRSEWIDYRQGALRDDVVERAVAQLVAYVE